MNIIEILNSCKGSDRYSSTDVEDAFFTIMLSEESRHYTTYADSEPYCYSSMRTRNGTRWRIRVGASADRSENATLQC